MSFTKDKSTLMLLVLVSFLTALFVVAIELFSSNYISQDDYSEISRLIDAENISGHFVLEDPKSKVKMPLDSLVPQNLREDFVANGFVKVPVSSESNNYLSFNVEKLLFHIDPASDIDILNSTEGGSGLGSKPLLFKKDGAPASVTICGSEKYNRDCVLKIKNDNTSQIVEANARLEKSPNSTLISIETLTNIDKNSSYIGKGTLDINVSPL